MLVKQENNIEKLHFQDIFPVFKPSGSKSVKLIDLFEVFFLKKSLLKTLFYSSCNGHSWLST